jgi:dolichol-phosphate mannosyltransferase
VISIILPTYNEVENIKIIVPKVFEVLERNKFKFEIIIVDDNSPDGTANVALAMSERYPLQIHVRKNERGLSSAVIKGFELARGDICVVMDADLSHPVEKLTDMIKPLLEGEADATVGSRYVSGGGCENWPLMRRIISKGSGLLAKGVTNICDPTSGFMAIKKWKLQGAELNPIGWKIVLEVIVKTDARTLEIPIVFADRQKGKSKLGLKAQIDYLKHLLFLYEYKYKTIFQFLKFCLVGLSGLFIDTTVLVSLVEMLNFDPRLAAPFAFLSAVTWNYILNRKWVFDNAKYIKLTYSYTSFFVISLLGLGIRIEVMDLLIRYAGMGAKKWYILASFIGICSATIINFIGSKYIAFSKRLRQKGDNKQLI